MDNKPALRPRGAVGDALRAVARTILAAARKAVDGEMESEAVAIHEFRKANKQWRALLRLLEPVLGVQARELRFTARELAAALATARDGQAALDALADLGEEHLSKRTIASITGRIDALKQAAEAHASIAELRPQLHGYLEKASGQVEQWILDQLGFTDIAACLTVTYRRARAAVPADWLTAEAEELHALRRRIIEHRYQLELIEPLWPRMGRLWVEEAQRLRDRLGAHHDLTVLAGLTAPHAPLAPWRSRLSPLIANRQQEHLKGVARLASRLLAEKPKAFRRRIEALWESTASAP
jgi:CHAD domain-containing protein